MSRGFEAGRVYNRGVDIHSRFGGQQQGGIITPAQHPIVIIITGEEGLALLWQIYSRCVVAQIDFRQCGHRQSGSRAMSSTMA